MQDRFDIVVEDVFIVIRPKAGVVVDADLIVEILRTMYGMREYTHEKTGDLWDYRGCRTSLDFDALSRVARFVEEHYDVRWTHERTAAVLDADVQYGLSRMYQTLVDEMPIDLQLFRDYDQAVAWMRAQGPARKKKDTPPA